MLEGMTQRCEIRFWNMITPMMGEKGVLMKILTTLKKILKSRAGYLLFLFSTFAAIGFVSGMILGRIIWMVQIP